jgi:protein arginine kinase activator
MLCDFCGKRQATVHLTEIIDQKISEIHLCQVCANKKSDEFQKQFSMADFLSELTDAEMPGQKPPHKSQCSNCGLTYKEFRKKGKLGCFRCYQDLVVQIEPLLKKIHGTVQHKGRFPKEKDKKQASLDQEIEKLKKSLARAVSIEEYEQAARLRDKINQLREKKAGPKKEEKG